VGGKADAVGAVADVIGKVVDLIQSLIDGDTVVSLALRYKGHQSFMLREFRSAANASRKRQYL
jgi:hypothetical protein